MKTIGVPENQIRIGTPPNADNLNPLAAQRVERMGDCHPSQRRLG